MRGSDVNGTVVSGQRVKLENGLVIVRVLEPADGGEEIKAVIRRLARSAKELP